MISGVLQSALLTRSCEIQWILTTSLKHYAHDVCLLLHRIMDSHQMPTSLVTEANLVGLRVSSAKTKILSLISLTCEHCMSTGRESKKNAGNLEVVFRLMVAPFTAHVKSSRIIKVCIWSVFEPPRENADNSKSSETFNKEKKNHSLTICLFFRGLSPFCD